MSTYEIVNLNEVLLLSEDEHIVSYKAYDLTSAGENYGSLMLALDVNVKTKEEKCKALHFVAKMCPKNEYMTKIFNVPVTFKKEIGFYKDIIPALQKLQLKEGTEDFLNIFPKSYGSRISLDPESCSVDKDAILILENLKFDNFIMFDAITGFDLNTARIIVKNLAIFHALPIALKIKNPSEFQNKVMVNLKTVNVLTNLSEEAQENLITRIVDIIKEADETKHLAERTRAALLKNIAKILADNPPHEPYGTIIHNDIWVNNILVKLNSDNKPLTNVMVDFQLTKYGFPAQDLLFFLYSSVQKEYVDKYYKNFVDLYHETFINTLKEFNCDTTPFSYNLLQEEIDFCARNLEFHHILIMLQPICSLKTKMTNMDKFTEEDFMRMTTLSDAYPVRIRDVVSAFAEKNWI